MEFNDTIVRQFDANDIPGEAFGGEEKWSFGMANAFREKSRNAYILFYDRSNYEFELNDNEQDQAEVVSLSRKTSKKKSCLFRIENF